MCLKFDLKKMNKIAGDYFGQLAHCHSRSFMIPNPRAQTLLEILLVSVLSMIQVPLPQLKSLNRVVAVK